MMLSKEYFFLYITLKRFLKFTYAITNTLKLCRFVWTILKRNRNAYAGYDLDILNFNACFQHYFENVMNSTCPTDCLVTFNLFWRTFLKSCCFVAIVIFIRKYNSEELYKVLFLSVKKFPMKKNQRMMFIMVIMTQILIFDEYC